MGIICFAIIFASMLCQAADKKSDSFVIFKSNGTPIQEDVALTVYQLQTVKDKSENREMGELDAVKWPKNTVMINKNNNSLEFQTLNHKSIYSFDSNTGSLILTSGKNRIESCRDIVVDSYNACIKVYNNKVVKENVYFWGNTFAVAMLIHGTYLLAPCSYYLKWASVGALSCIFGSNINEQTRLNLGINAFSIGLLFGCFLNHNCA